MKGVTEAKGLGDLRTAISHRIRANPPQKGTTYLEMYLLDKERQRLEQELSRLAQRRGRIDERLGEIRRAMEALAETAQGEGVAEAGTCPAGARLIAPVRSTPTAPKQPLPGIKEPALTLSGAKGKGDQGQWRRMTVDY